MVGHHGCLMTKSIKTTLAKMTGNCPRMLHQKINGSKPHDWILARSYFLRERLKTKENWQKNHSFYNAVLLKKPHSFDEPQLTHSCKKIYSCNTCFWYVSEKIFALHHFQTPENYILEALGDQVAVYSCKYL